MVGASYLRVLFDDCNAIFWFRWCFLWSRSRNAFSCSLFMISTQTFDHAFFEVLLLIIKIEVTLLSIATNFYGLVFDFSSSTFSRLSQLFDHRAAAFNFLSQFFAGPGTKSKINLKKRDQEKPLKLYNLLLEIIYRHPHHPHPLPTFKSTLY